MSRKIIACFSADGSGLDEDGTGQNTRLASLKSDSAADCKTQIPPVMRYAGRAAFAI